MEYEDVVIGKRYRLSENHLKKLTSFWRNITEQCLEQGGGSLVCYKVSNVVGMYELAPTIEIGKVIQICVYAEDLIEVY